MPDSVHILAIESSCDETAAAVVRDGRTVLSDVVSSQIDIHQLYGGVVPEIASRKHLETIDSVVEQAIRESGLTLADMDAISVAHGPGLAGALLVGLSYAKGLAWAAEKSLIGIDHMWGHVCANMIDSDWEPPFLCLVVSGGHTEIIYVEEWGKGTVIGSTVDDAAGEAFDKSARILGLGYPGGVKIDKLAESGSPDAYQFPRALMQADNDNFSFSGIKTAVMTHVNKYGNEDLNNLCASVRQAIVDPLVIKTIRVAKRLRVKKIALAGGVAANQGLRKQMKQACEKAGFQLHIPEMKYCTDNAAMGGAAAYTYYCRGDFAALDLNAVPYLEMV